MTERLSFKKKNADTASSSNEQWQKPLPDKSARYLINILFCSFLVVFNQEVAAKGQKEDETAERSESSSQRCLIRSPAAPPLLQPSVYFFKFRLRSRNNESKYEMCVFKNTFEDIRVHLFSAASHSRMAPSNLHDMLSGPEGKTHNNRA